MGSNVQTARNRINHSSCILHIPQRCIVVFDLFFIKMNSMILFFPNGIVDIIIQQFETNNSIFRSLDRFPIDLDLSKAMVKT